MFSRDIDSLPLPFFKKINGKGREFEEKSWSRLVFYIELSAMAREFISEGEDVISR
jgi:hypothetical protein